MTQVQKHWNTVYGSKSDRDVSWLQPEAQPSLDLILQYRYLAAQGVIDVGAGASRLVDGLLAAGLNDITLLDVAEAAFDPVRQRLGSRAGQPTYVIANAVGWQPDRQFGIWHDRAAFHFLTAKIDQDHYLATLRKSLIPNGIAILATFSPEGPQFCSGLAVQRYSSDEIGDTIGPSFSLIKALSVCHMTPQGKEQKFQYAVLQKRPDDN